MCVCEAPRAPLSSFWEQKRSALQAGPSRVLPCYLWKTRSVWIKQMMPRRTTTTKQEKKRSHDSFPKLWKRAKGQTNQWQFGWYLAPSIDRPWSFWHECTYMWKVQFSLDEAIPSWLTLLNTYIWSSCSHSKSFHQLWRAKHVRILPLFFFSSTD